MGFFEEMEERDRQRKAWEMAHPILTKIQNYGYAIRRIWSYHLSPRVFIRHVKVLFYWIPVVWNLNWWDHHYLLMVINHQLKFMDKKWHNSHYVGYEKHHKQIKIAVHLTNRLINDDYLSNVDRPSRKDFDRAERQRNNDLKYLCRIFEKHLFSWWD